MSEDVTEEAAETEWKGEQPLVYWGRDYGKCVTYCQTRKRKRRGGRCPGCYGPVAVHLFSEDEHDPAPGRWEQFSGWFGGVCAAWAAAWLDVFAVLRWRERAAAGAEECAECARRELIEAAEAGDDERD